ncbi:MAG TPA: pilus assembly protein PilM [Candidatus Paceibacterota bacterium]|nr:pilus assembly protein PilM [Candidatus Paceibacterota bacterium]HMP18769.1 pilus assembly protein PilM [Candidatus Paceibacterota bacterium]HMP85334.1 pilus assembly protein PilM [Candidatus Paceibacterota bacterium]
MESKIQPQKQQNLQPNFKNPFNTFFRKRIDTAFGMDISDTSIELLEFNAFFSHAPRSWSRVLLENGVVERGKILNKEILEQKIKILLQNAKPRKTSTNRVILSLPEAQVFTWGTAMDKSLSDSEIRLKILEEAKKHVPLDFKQIYWDYTTYNIPKKQLQYVTFIGIQQGVLNDYVEVCHRLGLEVVEFSLVCMCMGKVFLPPIDKDTHVVLDIGGEKSNITIFEGNSLLKLSTTVSIAGDSFTDAISNDLKITKLEAEEMKIKFGIGESAQGAYKNSITKIVDNLLEEVRNSINYYEKNSGETVDAIYLSGGSSMMVGLESYIEQKLAIKIQQINPLSFIVKSKLFENEINLKLFMGAVGLAMIGITKNTNLFSFRKQIKIDENKMSFWKIIKTGNFDSRRMIFAYTHLVYGGLTFLVLILTAIFTWMWMNLEV